MHKHTGLQGATPNGLFKPHDYGIIGDYDVFRIEFSDFVSQPFHARHAKSKGFNIFWLKRLKVCELSFRVFKLIRKSIEFCLQRCFLCVVHLCALHQILNNIVPLSFLLLNFRALSCFLLTNEGRIEWHPINFIIQSYIALIYMF
ncbi:hypothetical protein RR51_22995 [Pseudomonas sp. C5pp]|nr:hypothetical protein RR51_22995 [Pseudomonas sp. C5pp]